MSYDRLDYEGYDYQEFWQDDIRRYEDASERIALKKLMKGIAHFDGEVFVDLGCGFGRLISEYKDFQNIILIDYSLNNLKNAKKRISDYLGAAKLDSIYFICADALNIPLMASSVSVLISVRLIHHIRDISRYLAEIARVLAGSSTLILEFANKRNLKNIIRYLARKTAQSPYDGKPLKVGETILNWHPRTVLECLGQNGFTVQKKISVSNLRVSFLKKRLKFSFHMFLEYTAQRLMSFALLGPSIFLKANKSQGMVGACNSDRPFDLFGILVCPLCKNPGLQEVQKHIECPGCGRVFQRADGILDLRP